MQPRTMTVAELKRSLAKELRAWIKAQPLTQRELAPRLKLYQSQVSWLMTGKLDLVTLDTLLGAWFALGGRLTVEKLPRRETP